MEPSSVAEQRATAVAKLKRAASLPRMKDGRRPPMHVEAVSEGEIVDRDGGIDEESAQESDGKQEQEQVQVSDKPGAQQQQPHEQESEDKAEEPETPAPGTPVPQAEITPARKRRSRSRTRSRGSKDLRKAQPKPLLQVGSPAPSHANESSTDEYCTSAAGEEPPPSPPLVSPIPSHFVLPPSRLLASSPFLYPGTTPSTPMPTLDDIQHNFVRMGLYRSNSAGAARAMAMHKLTGGTGPLDFSPSPTPPPGGAQLQRNNTVSGGERMAARRMLLNRLGNRINQADGDQTSGGEEVAGPQIPPKRRKRRSKRAPSRASTVVDDREEREPPSTTPNTPIVPPSPLLFRQTPEPQRPPSATANRIVNGSAGRASPFAQANGNVPYNYEKPTGHRGVVVEDEDDAPEGILTHTLPLPQLPVTPARGFAQNANSRLPHSSDAPSNASTDSAPGSVGVPVFLSRKTGFAGDLFPASPFTTPLKENPYVDEDEEQVLYQETRSRSRLAFERESEISWVAEPVERMPLNDEDDDDEGDVEVEERQPQPEEGDETLEISERQPTGSFEHGQKDVVVELETSPQVGPDHIPPSTMSPIAPIAPLNIVPTTPGEANNASQPSPITYPTRLSVATPSQAERSPISADFSPDWEDTRATMTDATIKQRAPESTSTWERVKNAIVRSGSVNGRRSRTNSIGIQNRRNNTDSSVSRESHASISKEKGDQQGQEAQSPSASTSILSLPIVNQRQGVSPVPPATPADMAAYGYESNSKLNPFPGLKDLQEKRNRARGISMSQSVSSPDVASPNGNGLRVEPVSSSGSSSTTTRFFDPAREPKLSHQASDSRLLPKYNAVSPPPPVSSVPSTASQGDYFSVQSTSTPSTSAAGSLKLPKDREGVRKWLSAKKLFSSPVSTPNASGTATPPPKISDKKPSITDLLRRKDVEPHNGWEETGRDKGRNLTSSASNTTIGKQHRIEEPKPKPTEVRIMAEVFTAHDSSPEIVQSSKPEITPEARANGVVSPSEFSPHDHLSSTTPDPQSSLDDFPIRSTSESYSDTVSSNNSPRSHDPEAGAIILERLEEVLGRGSKSSWLGSLEDPPRKLVLCSPVFQVANAKIVKDRFLFLFNDILVIAKPIRQESDPLLDTSKPSPLDRKYIVKSVCRLRDLRFNGDRDEPQSKAYSTNSMKHPIIRTFVHQFAKDPDHAIATLFSKTSARDDPVALGQLLFRTLELDRVKLGEYLSIRSSKVVLRSYVDSFGLTGLRIDKALRVFLQAIHIPSRAPGTLNTLDYLLDSFSSRWYEANANMVTYDKDLATRLVRAIVQLNDVMHGGIAQEPGITGYPKRNIIAKDFVNAFRRYDPRMLVPDELLDKIYASVRRERLSQARNLATSTDRRDLPITIKRPLPSRLTIRVQSEPIVLRIPQPDPQFSIQLSGQDLIFEPSVLTFTKSAEASFRVTGTAFGPKSIVMWRSGPTGILYSYLPLSSPVVVERPFMRYTFQLAFANHNSAKRKYMFSVDDPIVRHQWTVSLKQHIDLAISSTSPEPSASSSALKTQKANEALALRVLQETLINPEGEDYLAIPLSPRDQAFAQLTGSRHTANGGMSSSRGGPSTPNQRRRFFGSSPHVRSKSRSKIYHNKNGSGKPDSDYNDSMDDDELQPQQDLPELLRQHRLWSGRDLEITCLQNSLIIPMLTYLQYDRRDHDMTNGAVS